MKTICNYVIKSFHPRQIDICKSITREINDSKPFTNDCDLHEDYNLLSLKDVLIFFLCLSGLLLDHNTINRTAPT